MQTGTLPLIDAISCIASRCDTVIIFSVNIVPSSINNKDVMGSDTNKMIIAMLKNYETGAQLHFLLGLKLCSLYIVFDFYFKGFQMKVL